MRNREAKTILIVDKSPTMLYYHGILLMRLQYSVLTASSPEDALSLMERTVPTIVLTATTFPQMTGTDFIRRLRGSARTGSVPVIVLTAASDDGVRAQCLEMGCYAFLTKPVEPRELYRTVQAATEPVPRANIRIGAEVPVVLGDPGGQPRAGGSSSVTKTLSEGGLFLKTQSPQAKNATVPMTIIIKGREINAEGVVLYSHEPRERPLADPGMALKFTKLSDPDREFLRGFINEQLTHDLAVDFT